MRTIVDFSFRYITFEKVVLRILKFLFSIGTAWAVIIMNESIEIGNVTDPQITRRLTSINRRTFPSIKIESKKI